MSMSQPRLSLVHNKETPMAIIPLFYCDKDIAQILSLSTSWVRGQRHKRRNGIPHILSVDPRYIGSCPRYLKSEIDAFIATIAV